MNRVNKRPEAPPYLKQLAPDATRALESAYDADPAGADAGTVEFASRLLTDKSVKEAPIADQFGKCCYCEARVLHVAFGDGEHYRPKAGWKQQRGVPDEKPGYYWLAYSWDNLFFACPRCNLSKGCLFPLRDETQRARDHRGQIEREEPLLLRPDEDPTPHLVWSYNDVVGRTDRGRASVDGYGLNRDALREARKTHLDGLLLLARAVPGLEPAAANDELIAEIRSNLNATVREDAEYTAMVRAGLP